MGEERLKETTSPISLTEARIFLITEVLPTASELLKRHFESGNFTSRSKGGVDFVTTADKKTDRFLIESIKRKYPQSQFLTEETAPKDYSNPTLRTAKNLWIIDPLDGTTNFFRGDSNFTISIALVRQGITQLAVVHQPMTEETFSAQIDCEGAFLNKKPLRVSETQDLKKTSVACGWPWDLKKRPITAKALEKLCTSVRQIKSGGSAVLDIVNLARGQTDVFFHFSLKPWDVAASSLILKKAGGTITTPNGDTWDVFNPDILASNGILHEKIQRLITQS